MEIDTPALTAVGVVAVVVAFADLIWTAIAVGQRRGPVSNAVARSIWALGRMGKPGHRRRRALGVVIAAAIPTVWLLILWAGFALMFLSDDDAVLVSASQQPVGALGRVAYAAGGLAGAGAGLIAGTETWQLVNNVAALSGLALVTLSLSYLMQVISAVVNERSTMSQIGALTNASSDPPDGQTLPLQLVLIGQGISTAAQRHLAFPMLQYFHSSSASSAAAVNIARYDRMLDRHEQRTSSDDATLLAGRAAIADFLGTLRLDGLTQDSDRRQRLDAFLHQEDWTWEDVTGA